MRNIGNMVPSYADFVGSVTAVIEYAVAGLKVGHIVICGHSDCGAMKALLNPASIASMPTVRRWLQNAEAALRVAETIPSDTDHDTLRILTEQNVLMQLAHLKTHPSVAGALARRAPHCLRLGLRYRNGRDSNCGRRFARLPAFLRLATQDPRLQCRRRGHTTIGSRS